MLPHQTCARGTRRELTPPAAHPVLRSSRDSCSPVRSDAVCRIARRLDNDRFGNPAIAAPALTDAAPERPPRVAYATELGAMYECSIEGFLASGLAAGVRGDVQLAFTSPPFPLNRKKKYNNLVGERYLEWLGGLAAPLGDLLAEDGSLVVELGNAWEPGLPVMSTLALEALLRVRNDGGFHLCQQFVVHNPARLPSPAQWVNVERIRVKDAYTNVWWLSRTPRPRRTTDGCSTATAPR